jgi:hypothetical protein
MAGSPCGDGSSAPNGGGDGTWEGVACNESRVTALGLRGHGLAGTLPSEVGLLTHLTMLMYSSNQDSDRDVNTNLTGTLPSELGALTALGLFYHAQTGIRGFLPSEIGQLSSLGMIHVAASALSGPLPSEIGLLTATSGETPHVRDD